MNFKGRAKTIDDVDLPRIAAVIGVGEDELHALMDVETRGRGFDAQGRPMMLFEPHIFDKLINPKKRAIARTQGLAYPVWGSKPYPNDSYPRLHKAMRLDKDAALMSASWGYAQIMGFNHALVGYKTAEAMVKAFMDDEERHIEAMVEFIRKSGIDDELREIASKVRSDPQDWAPIARVYNGPGYRKNNYHIRLAAAHNKWKAIPDTEWNGKDDAGKPLPPIEKPEPGGIVGLLLRLIRAIFGNSSKDRDRVDPDRKPIHERERENK